MTSHLLDASSLSLEAGTRQSPVASGAMSAVHHADHADHADHVHQVHLHAANVHCGSHHGPRLQHNHHNQHHAG